MGLAIPIFFAAMGGWGLSLLYKIFLEVRSIRRMMNSDRRIPNEVETFPDED